MHKKTPNTLLVYKKGKKKTKWWRVLKAKQTILKVLLSKVGNEIIPDNKKKANAFTFFTVVTNLNG